MIGDVVGKGGRRTLSNLLPNLIEELDIENPNSPKYKIKNRMDDKQHVVCFDAILGLNGFLKK